MYLLDVNVYVAASIAAHAHHVAARRFVDGVEPPAKLLFCRLTEMACLRLLTQPIGPGFEPLTNRDSLAAYALWRQDERVRLAAEPPGLDELWPRLALRSGRSPKLWTDAYLAAFAIAGQYRLVTFDGGFRQFLGDGLDLLLLDAAASG